ncbi:MAG TPA: hypothetical protein VMI54_30715 [Polyangiaceae bacterium]|nr:hypothetical protein [Polyangiaceae bacterium]
MGERGSWKNVDLGARASDGVEIIVETPTTGLYYDVRNRVVHHEIRSFVHGQPFRDLLERGLTLLATRGASKWLSDDRGNGPVTPADAEWALNDWAPRVIAAGWKYWAVILPKKVLGQMNMRRWMEAYAKRGVTVQAFDDPREARAWLESSS